MWMVCRVRRQLFPLERLDSRRCYPVGLSCVLVDARARDDSALRHTSKITNMLLPDPKQQSNSSNICVGSDKPDADAGRYAETKKLGSRAWRVRCYGGFG